MSSGIGSTNFAPQLDGALHKRGCNVVNTDDAGIIEVVRLFGEGMALRDAKFAQDDGVARRGLDGAFAGYAQRPKPAIRSRGFEQPGQKPEHEVVSRLVALESGGGGIQEILATP